MSVSSSLLRPITPADHAAVLAWNQANVAVLAPMDQARLVALLDLTETAAVITHDGTDVGFVFTFGSGSAYDSDNYRWFAARHGRFTYLDRVVVDGSVRRAGIGRRVYDELEAQAAATGSTMFCLEVLSDPPNDASLSFHRDRGYVAVGELGWQGHVVTMFEKSLG